MDPPKKKMSKALFFTRLEASVSLKQPTSESALSSESCLRLYEESDMLRERGSNIWIHLKKKKKMGVDVLFFKRLEARESLKQPTSESALRH